MKKMSELKLKTKLVLSLIGMGIIDIALLSLVPFKILKYTGIVAASMTSILLISLVAMASEIKIPFKKKKKNEFDYKQYSNKTNEMVKNRDLEVVNINDNAIKKEYLLKAKEEFLIEEKIINYMSENRTKQLVKKSI